MSAASGQNGQNKVLSSTDYPRESLRFEDVLLDLATGWLFYFVQAGVILFILHYTRRNDLFVDEFENSIEKDSVPKENGLSTSLEIDPWSLRFVAEKTRARYASYVREHVSPAVNKFMASLFFFFSITKMSRLFDSSQSEFYMVFRPLPAKDILHNVSTNIHVAIFFLVLSRVETSAGWKSCKACKRVGNRWRTFFVRDCIQATKTLLFLGPYITIMPGVFFCLQDGDFLPSAQCQHVHWGAKVKHRLFDDRMNSTFKALLNDQEKIGLAMSRERSFFERLQNDYLTRENISLGYDFKTWLFKSNMSSAIQEYITGHDGQLSFKFKIIEGMFVEAVFDRGTLVYITVEYIHSPIGDIHLQFDRGTMVYITVEYIHSPIGDIHLQFDRGTMVYITVEYIHSPIGDIHLQFDRGTMVYITVEYIHSPIGDIHLQFDRGTMVYITVEYIHSPIGDIHLQFDRGTMVYITVEYIHSPIGDIHLQFDRGTMVYITVEYIHSPIGDIHLQFDRGTMVYITVEYIHSPIGDIHLQFDRGTMVYITVEYIHSPIGDIHLQFDRDTMV
eukprot:g6105.t1